MEYCEGGSLADVLGYRILKTDTQYSPGPASPQRWVKFNAAA